MKEKGVREVKLLQAREGKQLLQAREVKQLLQPRVVKELPPVVDLVLTFNLLNGVTT